MPGQTRAFNEVKALLNKLDRGIDEAREKRLEGDKEPSAGAQPSAPPSIQDQYIGGKPAAPAATAPTSENLPTKPASPFGRARPIRQNPGAGWR